MLHRVILGIAIAALSCAAAVLLGAAPVLESKWAEPHIESWAGERLERTVDLDTIDIEARWPLRLTIRKLRVGNPEWAASPTLFEAEGLSATVRVDGFFDGIVMERLVVERVSATLERDGRRATWRLPGDGRRMAVRALRVGSARIHYRDRPGRTALLVEAAGTAGARNGSVSARMTGTLRGTALRAVLTAASVPLASDQIVPISFEGAFGSANASGSGKLRAGSDGLRGLDLHVEVAGASLRHLSGLLSVGLPETAPYRFKGRVHFNGERWTFDPFRATVGSSDVKGAWSHEQRDGRRYLRARLQSDVLDLDDVRGVPAVRAEGKAGYGAKMPAREQGWEKLNADLSLAVGALRHAGTVRVDSVTLRAKLEDSLLRLDPLTLGMAGSRVEGRVVVDPTRVPPGGRDIAWPVLVSSSLIRHRRTVTRIASAVVQALRGTVVGSGSRQNARARRD